ncbi:MAG: hypothetical protein ACLTEE_15295 [Anaerobutyricum hallii]
MPSKTARLEREAAAAEDRIRPNLGRGRGTLQMQGRLHFFEDMKSGYEEDFRIREEQRQCK